MPISFPARTRIASHIIVWIGASILYAGIFVAGAWYLLAPFGFCAMLFADKIAEAIVKSADASAPTP